MARVDLINEEAVAELMMSGGQGGGGGSKDQLLEYILENATLVATCQHTTEYSVKYYQGVICSQDPNLNLFAKELDDSKNAEQFKCQSVGYFINESYTKNYGTVALLDNTQVEYYIPYFSRVLFKNDEALYGDVSIINTSGYYNVIRSDTIMSELALDATVKEVFSYYSQLAIPKTASYIGDYKSKLEHTMSTYHDNILDVDVETISTNTKHYDMDGNSVSSTLWLNVPIEIIYYYIQWETKEIEYNGETYKLPDKTKIPPILEDRRNTYYVEKPFYLHELPNPDMMGNLKMADLSNVYFDYEQQRWAEATPKGYTPDAVRSYILPYPT